MDPGSNDFISLAEETAANQSLRTFHSWITTFQTSFAFRTAKEYKMMEFNKFIVFSFLSFSLWNETWSEKQSLDTLERTHEKEMKI